MHHDLVVEGKIVNPGSGVVHTVQIGIDGAFITELKKQGLIGERNIEVRGCLIFPGFIDLHAHLREDSSEKWSYKEDFRSGSAAAIHGGITTIADMPNTPQPAINAARLRAKKELAQSKSEVEIFFYGAVTESNTEELAGMSKEAIGYKIFLADGPLYIRQEVLPEALRAVEAASNSKPKPIVVHCEDQELIENRREELEKNKDVRAGAELHSWLRPAQAELSAVRSVLSCASGIRNSVNIAHISVYDSLLLIRRSGSGSGRGKAKIYCEVTPHHLFFNTDDLNIKKGFLKTNPPLRSESNRRQLLDAFKRGEIDFLVTDHAPHTIEEKTLGFMDAPAGVPNLDTFGSFVAWLIYSCGVSPELISRVCSYNPAKFLGLRDRGIVEVGKRANLTILEHRSVKVRSEQLSTKCGWSPFEGYEFPGTVRYTIVNGEPFIATSDAP